RLKPDEPLSPRAPRLLRNPLAARRGGVGPGAGRAVSADSLRSVALAAEPPGDPSVRALRRRSRPGSTARLAALPPPELQPRGNGAGGCRDDIQLGKLTLCHTDT